MSLRIMFHGSGPTECDLNRMAKPHRLNVFGGLLGKPETVYVWDVDNCCWCVVWRVGSIVFVV